MHTPQEYTSTRELDFSPATAEHLSLCETLDRLLNKGVVVAGEVTLSVANIDLIYLGLQVIITSIQTAQDAGDEQGKKGG